MVKIYIKNKTMQSLQSKLKKLDKYLTKKTQIQNIYSKDLGIYKIDNGIIYFLEPSFEEKYELTEYTYNNIANKLIIYYTNENKIPVVSQLPVEYIIHNITELHYKITDKTDIELIVCLGYDTNLLDLFIPTDFYFTCADNTFNLDNHFFQEDFNLFLDML